MSLTVSNRTNTVQCPKPLLTLNLLNVKYSKIKKKIKPFHHTMAQDIFSLRKRNVQGSCTQLRQASYARAQVTLRH